MLNRMKRLLSVFLSISLLTCPALAINNDSTTENSFFSLAQVSNNLTLIDALKEYPQLQEIYPIQIISAEEAATLIANGVDVRTDINAEEILAVPFLSQFNAVKRPVVSIEEIASLKTTRAVTSDYGAAWPYSSQRGTVPNCYAYAIGINSRAYNPGALSVGDVDWGSSVDDVASVVGNDMAAAFNGGSRSISSNTDSIHSYEWRIACRTGRDIIPSSSGLYLEMWDYHFWLQTSTGTWCHKPGANPSEHLGVVTPHNENWDFKIYYSDGTVGTLHNFYNSPTRYLAVFSG